MNVQHWNRDIESLREKADYMVKFSNLQKIYCKCEQVKQ